MRKLCGKGALIGGPRLTPGEVGCKAGPLVENRLASDAQEDRADQDIGGGELAHEPILVAKGAVEIIFRGLSTEEQAVKTAEYEDRFANPFVAASKGFIDEVIYPHSTRRRIALGLRKLRNKALENPWKKHDNIPL